MSNRKPRRGVLVDLHCSLAKSVARVIERDDYTVPMITIVVERFVLY